MPLDNATPVYLDSLAGNDRNGQPWIPLAKIFNLADGSGAQPIVGEIIRPMTLDWMSPGAQLMGQEINAPTNEFFPQNPADEDGNAICGDTLYCAFTYSGAWSEGDFTDAVSGGGSLNYNVDSTTGEITTALTGHGEHRVNGTLVNELYGPTRYGGSISKSTSSDIPPSSRSCSLSVTLTTTMQASAVASSAGIVLGNVEDNSTALVNSFSGLAVTAPVAAESYGTVKGSVCAMLRGNHDFTNENFKCVVTVQHYALQAALGFVGGGQVEVVLGGGTSLVLRDAFGIYSPNSPGLTGLPWMLVGKDVQSVVYEGGFRVKFASTDGRQYRITLTRWTGGIKRESILVVTNPGASRFETPVESYSAVGIKIPSAWSGSSVPDTTDVVVVTKVEVLNNVGVFEVQDGIADIVGGGSGGVIALMQVRTGRRWGIPALDGSLDTVYTHAVLTGLTGLGGTGGTCDCGSRATGGTSYSAQKTVDLDNGLLQQFVSSAGVDATVETLTNAGTYSGRAFVPFAIGEWPFAPEAADSLGAALATVPYPGGAAPCDVGDNPEQCPVPFDSEEIVLNGVTDLNDPSGARSEFTSLLPPTDSALVKSIQDVRWAVVE